jgi:hypothetical protein
LIEKAKRLSLIYKDQSFIPGERGEYPGHLETYRTTKKGLEILLRPVKISDEPLLRDFFHPFSDESLYFRFFSMRQDLPQEFRQRFLVIDYTQQRVILAILLSHLPGEKTRAPWFHGGGPDGQWGRSPFVCNHGLRH